MQTDFITRELPSIIYKITKLADHLIVEELYFEVHAEDSDKCTTILEWLLSKDKKQYSSHAKP